MAASDQNKCVKCKNTIKDSEVVLVCGLWCRKTFHNDCLGLSNREARAIMCSKVRIKFHCEACERRLAIELVRGAETQESKNLGNCVSLLELVQKLLKLTNELSSDNSTIKSKLDTVISSNTRLEEYLLPSSKRSEKQSEETFDNVVGRAGSCSTKRMAEICDQNTYTNTHNRLINSERICRESEFQGPENHLQRFETDFPEQVPDGAQNEETFENDVVYAGSYSTKRITEICERNNDVNSHDQIMSSEPMCRESEYQGTENHLQRFETDFPEQVPDSPQHEETFDDDVVYAGSYSTKRITEICERNNDMNSHDQIINSEPVCRESEFQQTGDNLHRIESGVCAQVADGHHQNFTGSYSSNCPQEWGVPEGHESTRDPLSIDEECMQEWEKPGGQDSTQVAPTFVTEECSPPEDFLTSGTFSIEKTENAEVEEKSVMEVEAEKYSSSDNFLQPCTLSTETTRNEDKIVKENNFQEVKHEMESTITGGEAESSIPTSVEDKINNDSSSLVTTTPLSARTGHMIQHTTKHQLSSVNRIDESNLRHGTDGCEEKSTQRQEVKQHTYVDMCVPFYSCSICLKTFTTSSNYKRHLYWHTRECPHSCSICDKTFTTNSDLKKHFRFHTGERPYSCRICNKAFTTNSDLKKHFRCHTGERPYSCCICNKTFTNNGNLRTHFRVVHKGKQPYSC